jgi:sterol desaturase/sphingolipid hydroxylase (fatty acid hydroxylase superfamily)
LTDYSFWFYCFAFFTIILARYFIIAGGAYLLFYPLLGKRIAKRSLRQAPPISAAIFNDIKLSILSTVVFAVCATFIILEYKLGFTLLYTDPRKYGLWYLVASFVGVLMLQDTYFYFMHRLFHHPSLFRWMHYGHHSSGDPTPWSSFAFDPPEAILQALFFVGIIFVIPLHFMTLAIALLTMTIWAVFSHLGFYLFPPSSQNHWLESWFIGPTYHSIHHRKYKMYYGLYFTVWDKLLGTDGR